MYTCKDNLTPLVYSGKIKKKIKNKIKNKKNNLSKNDASPEVDGHAYNANPGKNTHFKIIVEKVKCY